MSEKMTEKTYRIEGLSCTNCAGKFEKNVKQLPGVTSATVNFGASRISVEGQTTIEELEEAGAFENLIIRDDQENDEQVRSKESFIKRNIALIISLGFILVAVISQLSLGEDHLLTKALYILAIIIGGFDLFKEGFSDLIKLDFSMESLMTIAIIGAAFIGEWAEGSIVVILFAISEALERFSMDKARQSIRSLMDIAPKEALIRRNNVEQLVSVDKIDIDDIMIIKPGQKIAMDGLVINGHSSVNQAAITGESVPVEKQLDDEVFAGTLNEEGVLEVKVTKKVTDTTIAKIIHLVEEAQGERAPAQAFVDKFAKYYTPFIIIMALLIVVVPPLFFGGDWNKWLYQGLSILVVGCPCSLVISTPVSIVSAIGNAAKNGVLVKGGVYLEEIGHLRAIAFDKTGTLTKGKPVVTDFIATSSETDINYLSIISSLESLSQHPLASAILNEADKTNVDYKSIQIEDFQSITGKGLTGIHQNIRYYIGSPKLFSASVIEETAVKVQYRQFQEQGKTAMYFGTDEQILGVIAVADEVRDSSAAVISELHKLSIEHTIMLTGDNTKTAESIGKQLGVTEIKGDLMPQEKLDSIKALRTTYNKVAMVGDGINDAPALAASTVGIAMGGAGTDTALETADVALMGDDLQKLPFIVRLSRQTLKVIKQNITFSLGIKLLALLLVIPGWLTLWIAIVADMGATLLVTLNGLRLMKVK
ncbi:heavy metal translocating P-type ATPase [Listeria monocytogenes]|uniref:Probable cadmium-transporting ATPase n=6 Tax=Listeria TaxID=1637 RepID=Q2V4W3_LISMN|nr:MULTISPECIES: heavy metal translocating P-type ATPase [Bacilli]EAG6272384.1 cadmium-translocating P-type ATPase [Listeria monocytogenes CFSAN003726]EAG6284917.1 cadmium-translocating P-type ATPase [Listeria monocytogenes CFSAN003810]EAG6360506.1 cadmium-translocating P-type ATPase [Listeria monocytogenes CFSAN003729]EAG6369456.1 cadmium-translocating P-type ATPase [Listeria monocytogenes CFSAN003728]MCX62554.1 cadmium-translocating P-type ATPase [Listeria monocytogenes serotype 4b]MCX98557